ncbi:DUF1932 domain-containing protein [Nocardiopsis alba]|uniref:NAD(P)-dependent oxidoreductase n=1 Tax=Nocardiopsis alba TaxID=53437 RepID=UPI0033FC1427
MNVPPTVGLLHPGRMGAAVGRELTAVGLRVLWCSAGRSEESARRAERAGLEAVSELGVLLEQASVVISLCPPAAAEEMAASVWEAGFAGLFVDANAISPERVQRIATDLAGEGIRTVDGCVIGPPPRGAEGTHLYLSGAREDLDAVTELFSGTAVLPIRMEGPVGDASALKMAYGSYQKAACALAAVAQALGRAHGVEAHLTEEARRLAKSPLASPEYLTGVAAKAWRWAPEMREVSETLSAAGLPEEMAEAAALVFDLWESAKDDSDLGLPEALERLTGE